MRTDEPAGRLLVCNCQRTMSIDGAALAAALGIETPLTVHRELCRSETPAFTSALAGKGKVRVACTQEAALFLELAADAGADTDKISFVNIRERAGWCAAGTSPLPKMAALIAEATYASTPAGALTLKSEGTCLVIGSGETAFEAAEALADRLSVTLLLANPSGILPPASFKFPVFKGRVKRLAGHLGAFEVVVDDYAPMLPSSRQGLEFALPRNGARSSCDMVLDLSGGTPLMSEPHRRDGYIRVDPGSPTAIAKALLAASDLVGEFEKPLYVTYDASICAHARNGKVGCRKCLDACPMGAITPDGDHVKIDHFACAGCGNCSAMCPTGAVSHTYPSRTDLIGRAQVLLAAYRGAGGEAPVIMLHEAEHGGGLISAMARHGRGLPPNVLPMEVGAVTGLGHETMAAMLAAGATQIVALAGASRSNEIGSLESQAGLLSSLLDGLGYAGRRMHIVVEQDPDTLEEMLWSLPALPAAAERALPGRASKRELARVALAALHAAAPSPTNRIALPAGSPYGRVAVRTEDCTLCLSCVAACPANALSDNPDRPELSFTEAACVQCGVCVATCPESVIALEPRYDFTSAALSPVIIKSEEPFECVSCGKPFGARSSVTRVIERLKGHAMFQSEQQLRLIQMCDDCRVITVSRQGGDPLTGGERPRIRTTDDYIEAGERARATGRRPEDFLDD